MRTNADAVNNGLEIAPGQCDSPDAMDQGEHTLIHNSDDWQILVCECGETLHGSAEWQHHITFADGTAELWETQRGVATSPNNQIVKGSAHE